MSAISKLGLQSGGLDYGNSGQVLLGNGIVKVLAVMGELHQQNFQGLIAIEYEKEGDVNEDMKADVKIARALA